MEREIILNILKFYGIKEYKDVKEIDTSIDDKDRRINIILDHKYVLRLNTNTLTEEYIDSIDRLALRYINIGIKAPRIIKRFDGLYITKYKDYYCYISEYLDYKSLSEIEYNEAIHEEVLSSIGRFAKAYSNYDLVPWNSMWSIIDLSILDTTIDEKEENIILLANKLSSIGEEELSIKVKEFNTHLRDQIKKVYKKLPRCVIQGDLNNSNILVSNNHFIGLIDFNLSGSEVNINSFCNETNEQLDEEDFYNLDVESYYKKWEELQNKALDIILTEYELNDLERDTIYYYRKICQIAMYPNVTMFIYFLDMDKNKTLSLIKRIMKL